jgi:hypothetical protein
MSVIFDRLLEYRDLGYLVIIIALYLFYQVKLMKTKTCPYHGGVVRVLNTLLKSHTWTANQLIKIGKELGVELDPLPELTKLGEDIT